MYPLKLECIADTIADIAARHNRTDWQIDDNSLLNVTAIKFMFDGSAGKGRVLGQRDQARTGIGTARLPGIYPKEQYRPLLPNLRGKAVECAWRRISTVRNPQRAYRLNGQGASPRQYRL